MATFHVGIRENREGQIVRLETIEKASREEAMAEARHLVRLAGARVWRGYLNGQRIRPMPPAWKMGGRA